MPQQTLDEKSLFVETTIQVERVIGTQYRRNTIRFNLRTRRLSTSGHVLGEFNRTLIKDAINFRNLLIMSPGVEDAIKRLPNYIHSDRKYRRTVDLLASLGFDNDKQNTLDRLEKFIEWQGYDHFWDSIDRRLYTDEIQCILRSWRPQQNDTGNYDTSGLKCLKNDPPPCDVQEFIEKNRKALESLTILAKNHDRINVAKAANAFENILAGRDVPFGERSNCYPISDTLIALEAPDGAEIYSTDGDVHIICEILKKPLYTETPLSS